MRQFHLIDLERTRSYSAFVLRKAVSSRVASSGAYDEMLEAKTSTLTSVSSIPLPTHNRSTTFAI